MELKRVGGCESERGGKTSKVNLAFTLFKMLSNVSNFLQLL